MISRLSQSMLQKAVRPAQILVLQQRGIKPWDVPQPGAKNVTFKHNSNLMRMMRYFMWQYFWPGKQYGLQYYDQIFEPDPVVTEALRRLNLKEPWVFDQRKVRLTKAHNMALHHDRLPKNEWTKWEEETFYLKPYLDEVKAEMKVLEKSCSLLPKWLQFSRK